MTLEENFVSLTKDPIDIGQFQTNVLQRINVEQYGAVVTFCGIVRRVDERFGIEEAIRGIDYETYEELFVGETQRLISEVKLQLANFIGHVSVIHRIDTVLVGEITSAVIVAAKHRAEAFRAIEMITDGMKERVPLWKKIIKGDGTSNLVCHA